MLEEIVRWWLDQIGSLLPQSLGRRTVLPDAMIVAFEGAAYELALRQRDAVNRLAQFERNAQGMRALQQRLAHMRSGAMSLTLRVPASAALAKTIFLPLAARRNLAEVLVFEMSRETPFDASEVLWGFRVKQEDRAAGRMEVQLVVVPRSFFEGEIAALAAAEIRPDAVEVDGLGWPCRMAFGAAPRDEGFVARRAPLVLSGVTAALAVAVLITPFIRQEMQLGELRDSMAAIETEVRAAVTMKKEIEKLSGAADFLVQERARVGNTLTMLAAVTRVIPDNSYLTGFELHGGQLTLSGKSPSAAGLIVKLAETKLFKEPGFSEPVTRPKGDDLETFTITTTAVTAGGK